MHSKKLVALLFGGQSGEHEVSLQSAASILRALDRSRYDVVAVGIDRAGNWFLADDPEAMLEQGISEATGQFVFPASLPGSKRFVLSPTDIQPHIVFPVLHGTKGEDGTLQGMLEMMGMPYVGAGVLTSAVAMDKAITKDLFRAYDLPVADYIVVKHRDWQKNPESIKAEIEHTLGFPCFVKPNSLGSSLGVSKVNDRAELDEAMRLAAELDRKIIVEKAIVGREIEVSVLGNDDPIASVPGEIEPSNEFYDYAAKYIDGRSGLLVPAPLDDRTTAELQRLAIRAYTALDACGMARVDFFLQPDGKILINEVNTIPGFTSISMYPKMWEATGIAYTDLITELIELGWERHRAETEPSLKQP